MNIGEKFEKLCSNLRMDDDTVKTIHNRYRRITKILNRVYWGIDSETTHSLYVGSYGRGTAINVSDIDMLMILPWSIYKKYDNYSSNGESALLQDVKNELLVTYPQTEISGDGQVVKVAFTDDVSFEIIPCFENSDRSFYYPDTHNGGSWEKTDPRPEIDAINTLNKQTNKNLKRLCRMIRAWKDNCSVPMNGLLIDTFAYKFLSNWKYKNKSYDYYDLMTRDFFESLSEEDDNKDYWVAVGSKQYIYPQGKFSTKAKTAYNNSLKAIEIEKKYDSIANFYWKEIYGNKF